MATEKFDISTTIESQYGHAVTRKARSETRIGVVVKQQNGQLLVYLRVNKNGAITLDAQGTAGNEDAILFDGRVLAASRRYGPTNDGLALLEVRQTPTPRSGYEGEPDYPAGYRHGYIQAQAGAHTVIAFAVAGKSPAWRAGYLAGARTYQAEYMAQVTAAIKTAEQEEDDRLLAANPLAPL